jgi:NitT/TauT family transport system substrate-binding protein
MTRRTRVLRVLLALSTAAALLAAAGCSSGSSGGTGAGSSEGPGNSFDKVTYLTAFGAAGRDAFAWIAQEKGYFRAQHLDVQIQLGKATGENLKALASGQAQFAALDLTGAMISADPAKSTGVPPNKDFRAILAIHQQTLVSVMALEGSGITTPKALTGKKIAAAANSVNQMLFPGYAKLAGINTAGISWVAVQPAQLGPTLASGKVDALSTFLIGRPTVEKATQQAKGRGVVVFPYSQYLPDLYGNAVVTTTALTDGKPDLVRRFREAIRQALVYTIAHPDEAGALLHQKQPATLAAAATAEIKLMTPSVIAQGQDRIGQISQARMTKAIGELRTAGVVGTDLKPQDVVDFDVVPAG